MNRTDKARGARSGSAVARVLDLNGEGDAVRSPGGLTGVAEGSESIIGLRAGSPGRRVAGSPGRRVAGSPGRRVAGSPGRRVAVPVRAFGHERARIAGPLPRAGLTA